MVEFQSTNPNTTVILAVERNTDESLPTKEFIRQVLTIVGIVANNCIYHVAYALVEAATKNSWRWFLQCLGDDIDLHPNSNFTFISDRQKGIILAIKHVYPAATITVSFEKCMNELKSLNVRAHAWLSKIPAEHWSRAHFSGRAHTDILFKNICEVFNGKIVGGRDKPVITLLEYIREYCMKRIVNVQAVIVTPPKYVAAEPKRERGGVREKVRVFASKLIFSFPSEFSTYPRIPSYFNDQDATLLQFLDLSIHDFYCLIQYAIGPTLANTLKGPMYLGFSFPRLPKRITPFQGETFNITLSPTAKSRVHQRNSFDNHEQLKFCYVSGQSSLCSHE
ncbi:mutator type transposase [Tanacetum coccineum]